MATLTTTVQESVTINGKLYGNTIEKTHASIEQVYQQVVNVGTSVQEIMGFASTEKAGELADGKLRYLRITNTDADNFATIYYDIADTGNDTAGFKLEAGCSMVITHDSVGFGTSAATISSLTQLDAIIAKADTADVKLEIFIGLTA